MLETQTTPMYIAVDGAIGVGKTTLANMLAERYQSRLILESFEDNPFLSDFYSNPDQIAFQTQLFFLVARCKQQSTLAQQELFSQTIVSDYVMAKDQIFASLNLTSHELTLYNKIYQLLLPTLINPDLVVFLHAEPQVLLERLQRRSRQYERNVPIKYLENLQNKYKEYFLHYTGPSTVISVDTTNLNVVDNSDDFLTLVKMIENAPPHKTTFLPSTTTPMHQDPSTPLWSHATPP